MKKTRIVGIDFGLARIGVSISDETKLLASPYKTIKAEKKSEATVAKLLKELETHQKEYGYTLESIVVGLPLMMNGSHGLMADEVKHFISLLKEAIPVPIITWDERLSSVQAERSLMEGNFSRKKRAQQVDSVAAIIILQNYLDAQQFKKNQEPLQ